MNICNNNYNELNDHQIYDYICYQKCPQNCDQSFHSIIFEKIVTNNLDDSSNPEDLVLKIVNKPIRNYNYQANVKVELIECITNIGGLLGLYIGLSIVDLSEIAKTILIRVITMLESITSILFIRMRSKKFIKNIMKYLRMLKVLPLRKIFNIITTPILFMQLFYLVDEYLQYPTLSDIKFPLFEVNATSTNRRLISGREFPDISLCHRINIDELLYDTDFNQDTNEILKLITDFKFEQLDHDKAIEKYNLFTSTHYYNCENFRELTLHGYIEIYLIFAGLAKSKWTKIKLLEVLYDIFDNPGHNKLIKYLCSTGNKPIDYYNFVNRMIIKYIIANSYNESNMRMEPITDIDKYGLNATKDMFKLFTFQRRFTTRFGPKSVELKPNKFSLTPYGMCTTLSPGQQLADKFIEQFFVFSVFYSLYNHFTVLFHPFDTLPVRQLNPFAIESVLHFVENKVIHIEQVHIGEVCLVRIKPIVSQMIMAINTNAS